MLEVAYNILFGPIELFIGLVFSISNRILDQPGVALIFVSIAVNLLVLPLYRTADKLQEQERVRQKAMKPFVNHIRETFNGDEKVMMLSTYYRQMNYSPFASLRGSLSLLLQIPFFVAAYRLLSTLPALRGSSFLFISDLAVADGYISIGSIIINVLPILMTLINILTGMIYTKGFEIREKIQLYGVAAVFLVLLYNSPSGLVFYWTCNNTFSLLKNLVLKSKESNATKMKENDGKNDKFNPYGYTTFLLGLFSITIVLGALIPLSVMYSAPGEFVTVDNTILENVVYSLSIFFGIFIVWVNIFYGLSSKE